MDNSQTPYQVQRRFEGVWTTIGYHQHLDEAIAHAQSIQPGTRTPVRVARTLPDGAVEPLAA